MPEITSAEKNGHIRHMVNLEPGEKVMLCRCNKSSTYPFCDITHSKSNDELGPVIVEAARPAADEQKASK
jgi:CDGSH-type Zn-finger protein